MAFILFVVLIALGVATVAGMAIVFKRATRDCAEKQSYDKPYKVDPDYYHHDDNSFDTQF